jgi:hypothetical protein
MPFKEPPDTQVAIFGALIAAGAALVRWVGMNRRSVWRLIAMIVASTFWGAISAWVIFDLWKDVPTGIAGAIVAILSHAGTEATVNTLKGVLMPMLEAKGQNKP